MGLLTRLRLEFESFLGLADLAADYGGSVKLKMPPLDVRWPSGAGADQANVPWGDYEATLAAAGTRSLDLRALPNLLGGTSLMAEVRAIGIYVHDMQATDALLFAKGASNGWTGLGASFSVEVQRGTWVWFVCPLDGEYATGAANKVLDITNNSAAQVTYSIVVIGTAT